METLFNPDNPFWSFIGKIVGICVLSMVFTLCCLPIVTIGPACAAMYYAVVKSIRRERGYYITEFFHAFRDNLKKGIVANLILLALAAMMFLTDVPLILSYLSTGKLNNAISTILFLAKLALLLGVSCWIYPLMSRFDQRLTALFGYSLLFLVRNFLSSICGILILFVAILLIVFEPLLLAIMPGTAALLISFRLEPVLQKLCGEPEDDSSQDLWYLGR